MKNEMRASRHSIVWRWSLYVVGLVWLFLGSGCLTYIPIEGYRPVVNQPPRILIRDPTTEVTVIPESSTVTFRIQVADSDLQDTLYVYWFVNFDSPDFTTPCGNQSVEPSPSSDNAEIRAETIECIVRHNGIASLRDSKNVILSVIVSDRKPIGSVPQSDGTIQWQEGTEISIQRFALDVE